MKRLLVCIVSAAMVFAALSGCSKPVSAVNGQTLISVNGADTGCTAGTSGAESNTGGTTTVTTAIVVITDKNGKTVTKPDGTPETTIVTTLTTSVVKVTTPGGKIVTQPDGKAVTTVVTTPTVTTRATAGGTTSAAAKATTAATIKHTTTTAKHTTTTTKRTTTTTKKATTTADDGNSWTYPYGLNAIYADCKTKVESYGVTWDDSLRPDTMGVSWDDPESTYYYTHHPEDPNLKKFVFGDIDYYCNSVYTHKPAYCRVWFEPDTEDIGDYYIYILEVY